VVFFVFYCVSIEVDGDFLERGVLKVQNGHISLKTDLFDETRLMSRWFEIMVFLFVDWDVKEILAVFRVWSEILISRRVVAPGRGKAGGF
jgi:hypothetical protein